MEQQSRGSRHLKRVRATFPVGIVGDLLDGKGQLLNLSSGGCCLRADQRLKQSPYLRLLLHAPNESSPIKVELAIVRWISGDEFGLEFIRIHADHQRRLRHLLDLLETQPDLEHRGQVEAPAGQPA